MQWLLSQGSKIEVIKPVWLREKLHQEIQADAQNISHIKSYSTHFVG
ncbi:MAG: hypothetical protein IPP76_13040 [Moraxellaceae bacterium]|nr:hypothetical protein [Moraxellaceae bacterium]